MESNKILAFSSSRSGKGGYLETARPIIEDFLGNTRLEIAFIPFASVGNDYEDYASMVKAGLAGLPYELHTVMPGNAKMTIGHADVIMIGGGNTFKLLHDLYAYKLIDVLRNKVNKGTPYIGWSAGSNITGPTIGTTNDMPVVQPESFNALGLLPFQINPHYTNRKLEGHNGESRDQRLEEFLIVNPGISVVGLPEGTALKLDGGALTFIGECSGVLFSGDTASANLCRRMIEVNEDLSFLL